MFKAILWDNDGILVQTEEWYYEANRQVLAGEGVELPLEIYYDLLLKKNTGVWHLLESTSDEAIDNLKCERNRIFSDLLRTEDIFVKGASDVLDSLHSRYAMGIVTSSRKDHFAIIHDRTRLLPYFDFVVASGDFTNSKPDPEPYLIGIDRTGYAAHECLAIEDSERGVLAAKRAGLTCWAIPSAMTGNGDFSIADQVLDSLRDIPPLLDS